MQAPSVVRDDVDFLSLLSDVNRRRFLEGSTKDVYAAGTVIYHPDGPYRAFLLERGLVRGYTSVPDGRQASVTFFHSKELVGGTAIASHPPLILVQVVVKSTLIALDLEGVRRLAATENEVLAAIAVHLASRIRSAYRLIAVRSLGSIRQRLAYDLLERACRAQLELGRLEARATHAELADSIGSSREVVSRALSGLRADELIETLPGLVRVLEPIRLAEIVRAFVI
ncbi:MAG TPA: Crp/Fnr family transcriptional regulator [Candidatus Dormibacteraeota bacterium]|nr:Crp/Fnr family transcriptional regulator [Candidatus Dormibacteraeota bacterium]